MAWAGKVRALLPRCPGYYVDEIGLRLSTQDVPPALEKQAMLGMAEAVIRHQLTDYDTLTKNFGLLPDEAKLAIADEVNDTLAEWCLSVMTLC